MIKKKYLAQKVAEQEMNNTFHERREYKPFWRKRIGSVDRWKLKSSYKSGRLNDEAVFLCGSYTFMADILNITLDETPAGIEEVVPGDICYNIECKFRECEIDELSVFLSGVV